MIEELINNIKNGDENAFIKLIEPYKTELYNIARARTENEDEVEEVIQQTLFDVYTNLSQLKSPESFKFWIIRILINNCYDIFRYKYNDNIVHFSDGTLNNTEDPHNVINNYNSNQNFHDMIKFLSPEDRTILIMRYSLKYKTREISETLNIKHGALRMRILRIKEKIKERYGGNYQYV